MEVIMRGDPSLYFTCHTSSHKLCCAPLSLPVVPAVVALSRSTSAQLPTMAAQSGLMPPVPHQEAQAQDQAPVVVETVDSGHGNGYQIVRSQTGRNYVQVSRAPAAVWACCPDENMCHLPDGACSDTAVRESPALCSLPTG